MDSDGYLRVTDFGIARKFIPNNAQYTSGTPGYMAPEVMMKTNHSYGVDFWAMGVIAFEIMMGARPY